MIIFKEKQYTEKYRKISDSELAGMTKGQRLRALEVEASRAQRNTDKISKPYKILGTVGGAGLGLAGGVASKNAAAAGTATVVGGLLGYETGHYLGKHRAAKKGHDPEGRTIKLARRMDKVARRSGQDDIYEHEAIKSGLLKGIKGDTKRIRENTITGGMG